MDTYVYYCGLTCLCLFAAGGCHELVEFAITTVYFAFKLVYIVCEACTKQSYENEDNEEGSSAEAGRSSAGAGHRRDNLKKGDADDARNIEIPLELNPFGEANIFDGLGDMSEGQEDYMAQALAQQIAVHEMLLDNLDHI